MTAIEINSTSCSFKELSLLLKNDDTKTFILSNVNVEGTQEDMHLFFASLRGHPVIEVFCLVNVTTDEAGLLNIPVSSLLLFAPNLRTVHIENSDVSTSVVALAASYSRSLKCLSGLSRSDYCRINTKRVARAAVAA